MRRVIAVLVVAALTAAGATVAWAQSATKHVLSFDMSATPLKLSKPGKPVGLTLRYKMSLEETTEARVAQPDRMTFLLPATKINPGAFPHCTKEILRQKGPTGCPEKSLIGKGTGTGDATPLIEEALADIMVFNGPKVGGKPTLVAWGKARGVQVTATLTGTINKTSGKYGYRVDLPIPGIPTLIGQPEASVDGFDVKVGAKIRKGGKTINFIESPLKCPAGGFKFVMKMVISYHPIIGAEPGETFPGYPTALNAETLEDDATIACPK